MHTVTGTSIIAAAQSDSHRRLSSRRTTRALNRAPFDGCFLALGSAGWRGGGILFLVPTGFLALRTMRRSCFYRYGVDRSHYAHIDGVWQHEVVQHGGVE